MSNRLVPFEQCEKAMELLNSGKALDVEFVFDDDGPYKGYKNYYYEILGYKIGDPLFIATILSEIGNMPGHYVVLGNGKICRGLHGDLFHIDVDELEEMKDII